MNPIKIATWNIQAGGSPERNPGIVAALRDFDIVVLTEYKCKSNIQQLLFNEGWRHIQSSVITSRERGVLVASRLPIFRKATLSTEGEQLQRRLDFSVPDLDLEIAGVYAPTDDSKKGPKQIELKHAFWSVLSREFLPKKECHRLLIGDFNNGCCRRDIEPGAKYRFKCADQFDALDQMGWIDLWRLFHLEKREYSWRSQRNGFRLDHAFGSSEFARRLVDCQYSHTERQTKLSDHSILWLAIK